MQFELHVVSTNVPILLSIEDMDHLGVFFNNLTSQLVHLKSRKSAVVSQVGGHPFLH